MTEQEMQAAILWKLMEEKQRLLDAGVVRNRPETWRPDLVRSIADYRREIENSLA